MNACSIVMHHAAYDKESLREMYHKPVTRVESELYSKRRDRPGPEKQIGIRDML